MLGPTYLDFIRYFYCACLTRPPDFLSRFRNLAGATQRIRMDKIESQVAPAEEAGTQQKLAFAALLNRLSLMIFYVKKYSIVTYGEPKITLKQFS